MAYHAKDEPFQWYCAELSGETPQSRMAEVEALVDEFELDREFEIGGEAASQSFDVAA